MLRTLFLFATGVTAMTVTMGAVILGGCGRKPSSPRTVPDVVAAPAVPIPGIPPESLPEIGRNPSTLGRIEQEVVVQAILFHAEHGSSGPRAVRLAPGTWLLPATAMQAPAEPARLAAGRRR